MDKDEKQFDRLGLRFHQTFIPERHYISALLRFCEEDGVGSDLEIFEKTGIPTGKSSGKIPAIIKYGKGMGLVEIQGQGKTRVLRPTDFGKAVLAGDPNLGQAVTQWTAHLHLCRRMGGAETWFLLFGRGEAVLGNEFTREKLEDYLFKKVIVEGCWPFHPLAILFLRRMSDRLQQRSAVTFISEALSREAEEIEKGQWNITATRLFQARRGLKDPLLQELVGTEKYSSGGASAHAYSAVEEKYGNDLAEKHRRLLLSVLIADKSGFEIEDRKGAHFLFAQLSGLKIREIENAVSELVKEYGVLEWNDRFKRYEITSDAVPRSAFNRYLERKVKDVPVARVQDLFLKYIKRLVNLPHFEALDPEFSNAKAIRTAEWQYKIFFSHENRIDEDLRLAVADWKQAIEPDKPKGQLIYYYLPADSLVEQELETLRQKLKESFLEKSHESLPVIIVALHDSEEKLRRGLAEYCVLTEEMTKEENIKYGHFIDDQIESLKGELTLGCEELVKKRQYALPVRFSGESRDLKETAFSVFFQRMEGFRRQENRVVSQAQGFKGNHRGTRRRIENAKVSESRPGIRHARNAPIRIQHCLRRIGDRLVFGSAHRNDRDFVRRKQRHAVRLGQQRDSQKFRRSGSIEKDGIENRQDGRMENPVFRMGERSVPFGPRRLSEKGSNAHDKGTYRVGSAQRKIQKLKRESGTFAGSHCRTRQVFGTAGFLFRKSNEKRRRSKPDSHREQACKSLPAHGHGRRSLEPETN